MSTVEWGPMPTAAEVRYHAQTHPLGRHGGVWMCRGLTNGLPLSLWAIYTTPCRVMVLTLDGDHKHEADAYDRAATWRPVNNQGMPVPRGSP